ncbi:hypothetical protein F4677DRAFT_422936 [Hypoxylon crocopeplum]|nr:hypothetical protein F4677DRAFT_422936 [Hypoxylon crocopeplum]
MAKITKDKVKDVCALTCAWPFLLCILCLKYSLDPVADTIRGTFRIYRRFRARTRRLPKSKSLITTSSRFDATAAPPTRGKKTSFLHLPPEIRLQIYRLALGQRAIVQVDAGCSFWGARPQNWGPGQGIRDDGEEPSKALRTTIGLGGSGTNQLVYPPRSGCVFYSAVSQLICGETWHTRPRWVEPESEVFYSDLMRACRIVYGELLDVLYADSTISLFGADMVRYFRRNASPEGLGRVRFVHVALIVQSSSWDSSLQRKTVQGTVRMLRDLHPGLRQLDVEVVLLWGQPKDPQRFWAWLREDVLGQLRGLERFVLKIPVYKPFRKPQYGGHEAWTPKYEALSSWDDSEYQALKDKVTSSGEAVLC